MTAFMPKWRQFDTQAARILSLTSGRGRVVLFGMTPDFMSGPEAMRLAVSVGRSWADSGVLVVLADGCFEDPRLHDTLHLPNDGGFADVLFLDTPLREMVQPGGRRRFHVLTTGVRTADSVPRVEASRWTQMTATIHEEAVTFAVLARLDSALGLQVLAACTDIVVLANSDDEVVDLLPAGEERVREVIGPAWRRPQPHAPVLTPAAAATPESGTPHATGSAPEGVVRQIVDLFETEQPPPPTPDPNLRRRGGRDRRISPDRRQQLWKEAADTVRHHGGLPPGVLTDRRGQGRRERRVSTDRRADFGRKATPAPLLGFLDADPQPTTTAPAPALHLDPVIGIGVPTGSRPISRQSGWVVVVVLFAVVSILYAIFLWPLD